MNTDVWIKQATAITRLELKRFLLARRWIGVYFMAIAPIFLTFMFSRMAPDRFASIQNLSQVYANLFQLFLLRFGIFLSCTVVFSQVFRGDVLEKTLHFYLLAPVRREIVAVGKYAAGVILVAVLFSISIASTHLLLYSASPNFSSFYLEGPGITHLISYVAVGILATFGYGSLFLLAGMLFKNPGIPALFLMGWESFNFALPVFLQRISVINYLLALMPVTIDRGPFAVISERTPPIVGIPVLLIGTAIVLAVSGWYFRFTQVTYSAD